MWITGYRKFQRKAINRYQNVTFKKVGEEKKETRKLFTCLKVLFCKYIKRHDHTAGCNNRSI